MRFGLDEDRTAIREMALGFAAEHIAPHALDWDREKTFPVETLRVAAALGMAGIYVREDVGGSGLSRLDATLIFEALSTGCPTVAAFLSIHNMCAWMIDAYGDADQRQRWLPSLMGMERIASYCLTEPGSGSDAAALRTRAERDGDHYVLTGEKQFISGAGASDLYLCMVRTGEAGPAGISALVVEKGTPGLSFGADEHKMGWNAQPSKRTDFQALQFRLADMATSLEVSRTFLRHAASALDARDPAATQLCAMAKRHVTDAAFEVANQALQLHGGYGYLAEYGVEKIVRDLRVHQILEGTNEIMRVIIARGLIGSRR